MQTINNIYFAKKLKLCIFFSELFNILMNSINSQLYEFSNILMVFIEFHKFPCIFHELALSVLNFL